MQLNSQYRDFQLNRIGKYGLAIDVVPQIAPNGDFRKVTGKDAIVASIKHLLMTPLGLYPFDPTYGSLLHQQLFELADDITFNQIEYEVKNRIEAYEDRVTVHSVNISWIRTDKLCQVSVTFTIEKEVNKTKLSLYMKKSVSEMFTSLDSTSANSNSFST